MANPQENLAASLEALRELQGRGVVAIRSRDLSRTHRERLLRGGFLEGVIKGWYIVAGPDAAPGDSTAWYVSFWNFCAAYLAQRFSMEWCLSPEQSLSLHAGNWTVPVQLVVHAPNGGNRPVALPHGTSLFDMRNALPPNNEVVERQGLRLFSVPAALVAISESSFRRASTDVRAAMATVKDASDVLVLLLEGGHSTVAGRLAGAFRNTGRARLADEIVKTMRAAGYTVRESDPFEDRPESVPAARGVSPYVNRIRLMWEAMRQQVLTVFPAPPGRPAVPGPYLAAVDDAYVNDARTLHLRLRPSLSGWQRPDGAFPDERDARLGRVSMDDRPGGPANRLHGRAGIGQRQAGCPAVRDLRRRFGRGEAAGSRGTSDPERERGGGSNRLAVKMGFAERVKRRPSEESGFSRRPRPRP